MLVDTYVYPLFCEHRVLLPLLPFYRTKRLRVARLPGPSAQPISKFYPVHFLP